VIDLHSLYETNLLGFLGGIPRRLYAQRENRSLDRLSNFRPAPPVEDKALHLTLRYLAALKPLGVKVSPSRAELNIRPEDAADITRKWPLLDGAVGIFPGAGHPSRKWPLENFAAVARHAEDRGLRTAVFLGPEESDIREQVKEVFAPETVLVEGLTLPQLAAAISRLAVLVGNDSGPAHIAACTPASIVLVMGEEAPDTYLPFTDRLTVVNSAAIGQIPVDEVTAALDRSVKANDNRAAAC
jgi:ADP-heptose:LPS heptosyltransferase